MLHPKSPRRERSAKRRRLACDLALLLALNVCPALPSVSVAQAQTEPELSPPVLLAAEAPAWPSEVSAPPEPVFVVLELTVDADGNVQDPEVVVSGGAAFDREALRAVGLLRFAPATRDGKPIAGRIPFRFAFTPPAPESEQTPAAEEATPDAAQADAAESAPQLADAMTLEVFGDKPAHETTVHQVASEEIRVIPGTGGDTLRAVETLPGVGRPPGVDGQLIVRGSAPQDTAVFIDGITIPLAYHFGGIVSVVPSEALSKLDYRPGNFGTEYGRAMGGVIDVGLRSPRRDRFGGVVQVDVIDGRLMLEGPLSRRTRLMVAGRRSWIDAWAGKAIPDLRTAPVYYDAQAVLEHDFSERTKAKVFFLGSDDRIALFAQPGAQDPVGGAVSARTGFTRLAARVDSRIGERWHLSQTLAVGTEHYKFNFGAEFSDALLYTGQSRTEVRVRMHDAVTGVFGADALLIHHNTDMRLRPYPATGEVEGPYFGRPTRSFHSEGLLVRPAAYAALELTPAANLRLVPGVRMDYGTDTQAFTVDPRLTARYELRPQYPRTAFKSGIGLFHQPPQYQESVKPFGSEGVKSNRALHASLGVEQDLLPGFDVSFEGFYKHLTQLIVGVSDESESALGALFKNQGRGRVYGGEMLLRYRPSHSRFFGWIAYTLSRSERANASGEELHAFEWDQTHIFSALGNVRLGRGFSVGGRFRYVTGVPCTPYVGGVLDLDAGAYAPVPASEVFSARLPAFHQLDLRVEKTFDLGRAKLLAYLELRNAYNHQNAEGKAYSYDYAQSARLSGLPLLPVLGLRGEL